MWKDVPVLLFSLQAGRKDLTHRPKVLSHPPPPPPTPPPSHCSSLLPSWNSVGFGCTTFEHPLLDGKKLCECVSVCVCVCVWGGGGGVDFHACVFFYLLVGKNNTGTSFHKRRVGLRSMGGFWHTWKFNSKTWLLPRAIQLLFVVSPLFSLMWLLSTYHPFH